MRICYAEGCSKSPSFNYAGQLPKYCKTHKFIKMVNVKYKRYIELNSKYYILNIDDDIKYILNLQTSIQNTNIIPNTKNNYVSKSEKFRDKQKKLVKLMNNHIEYVHYLISKNNVIDIKIINNYIDKRNYILNEK
jgi:hypothetical protein